MRQWNSPKLFIRQLESPLYKGIPSDWVKSKINFSSFLISAVNGVIFRLFKNLANRFSFAVWLRQPTVLPTASLLF